MTTFNTILVPVDFSENTDVAVKKAIELADPYDCVIHLLHVVQLPAGTNISLRGIGISTSGLETSKADVRKKLMQWKVAIEESIPHIQVRAHLIDNEHVQSAVIQKAAEIKATLIVIGKKSNHSWFPFLNTVFPNEVSKRSGCAVLVVKPGALHANIKTLLVPITDNVPLKKMEVVQAIARKFRVKIYLVTFMNQSHIPEQFSASSLLQVYQWLKTTVRCPVEYAVLHGRDRTKAMLAYAEKIGADVLLVHSASETKISWYNTRISDVLSPASKVQVLMVQPVSA